MVRLNKTDFFIYFFIFTRCSRLAYGYWFFVITITLYMTFIVALTKSVINLHYDFITLPVNETTEAENQATNESIALEVGPITAQVDIAINLLLNIKLLMAFFREQSSAAWL